MSKSSNENPAFICIPDISGFTRFMSENKMDFSKKMIPGLLQSLVDANAINLKVGEIEGDAVVFYRFGELPSLQEIADQCKQFYLNFNEQLKKLMEMHAGDFHQNISSNRLSLKIIVHAAEMISAQINGNTKLIGEDMVIAHKLLKNNIPEPEYVLLSEKLLANYANEKIESVFNWNSLVDGEDEYEFIGTVKYRYIILDASLNEKGSDQNGKEGKPARDKRE